MNSQPTFTIEKEATFLLAMRESDLKRIEAALWDNVNVHAQSDPVEAQQYVRLAKEAANLLHAAKSSQQHPHKPNNWRFSK